MGVLPRDNRPRKRRIRGIRPATAEEPHPSRANGLRSRLDRCGRIGPSRYSPRVARGRVRSPHGAPVSGEATRRIVRYAFDYARQSGRGGFVAVNRAESMKCTDGPFLRTATRVAAGGRDIDERIVDKMNEVNA